MINGKSILAIIAARGGSKGLPGKNILEVGGKPLIAWTIEEARKSKYIDRIILSSEDEKIISVAKDWGCEVPFVRPAELAQDETPGIEPVLHALDNLKDKYDYIVLLQPTSPLRRAEDIDGCIDHLRIYKSPFCVSVCQVEKSPYWMYEKDDFCHLIPIIKDRELLIRRQDVPSIYVLNGAVYVGESSSVQKLQTFITPETVAYVMPKERSLDIDTEIDITMCDYFLSEDVKNNNM